MLRPAQLADLSLTLAQHDFVVSTQQTLAAARLLAGLPEPVRRADLALWLAPVFCSNRREQSLFPGVVADWARVALGPEDEAGQVRTELRDMRPGTLPRAEQAGASEKLLLERDTMASAASLARYETLCEGLREKAESRRRHFLASAFSLAAVGIAFVSGSYKEDAGTGGTAPPVIAPRPAAGPAPASGAKVQDGPVTGPAARDTVPPAAPPALARQGPSPGPAAGLAEIALLGAACTPMLAWLLLALRRRGFLERQPARSDDIALHLRSAPEAALGSWRPELASLGRVLRRRVTQPSPELDVPATLSQYLRTGLLSKLFFGSRHEPDYLVLIDSLGSADHYARVAEEVADALQRDTGVNAEVFLFQSDPRILRHLPPDPRQAARAPAANLDGLFGRFPQSNLLVFSDGLDLISPLSGKPAPWLSTLLQWPRAVLVTPRPRKQWSVREDMLRKAGLDVVPLDSAGLALLGAVLTAQQSVRAAAAGEAARATPPYLRDFASLLDTVAPAPHERDALLGALRRDLGPRGFVWLCACAVYPEIQWGLTLALGQALLPDDDERAGLLVGLSGLPWLRRGFMPDWLRAALLDALDPADAELARAAVADYLARVAKGGAALADHAEGDDVRIGSTRKRGFWHDAARGLAAAVRRPRAPDVREDRVYLRFISGKPPRLSVSAGEQIARLFHQDGSALGRPKTLPYLLLSAMLAGAAAFQLGYAQQAGHIARAFWHALRPGAAENDNNIEIPPPAPARLAKAPVEPAGESTVPAAADAATQASSPVAPAQASPPSPPPSSGGQADGAVEASALPYRVVFSSVPTGRSTSNGPEFAFRFSLVPAPDAPDAARRFREIWKVVYTMDNATFRQKTYASRTANSGFSQTYSGWGCLNSVGIAVSYKDGRVEHSSAPMCEVLNQPQGTAPVLVADTPRMQAVPEPEPAMH